MKTRFVLTSSVLFLVVIVLFSLIPSAFAPYHGKQQSEAQQAEEDVDALNEKGMEYPQMFDDPEK